MKKKKKKDIRGPFPNSRNFIIISQLIVSVLVMEKFSFTEKLDKRQRL